jgi:hypothetical protein
MELFEEVFNKASIYDMLFFNIKAVLEYPTLADLQERNPAMYNRWLYLAGKIATETDLKDSEYANKIYQNDAIFHPEFSRIVAITYASIYAEDGKIKRFFKKINGEDEMIVIATFMDVLHGLSSEGATSTPPFYMTFCGHNIINYDIPLLVKRFIKYKDKLVNKQLPYMLKRCLGAKPWDASTIIDTVNVWKFNGNDYSPLMLIADYLELKKNADLETLPEVSKHYWNTVADKPEEALEYVSLQSANQTNLVIQLMNELRQL